MILHDLQYAKPIPAGDNKSTNVMQMFNTASCKRNILSFCECFVHSVEVVKVQGLGLTQDR